MRAIANNFWAFLKYHVYWAINRIELYLFLTLIIIAFSQSNTGLEDILYIVKWVLLAGLIVVYFFSVQIETKSFFNDNELFKSNIFRIFIIFILYNIIILPFSIDIVNSVFKIVTTIMLLTISFFILPKYVLLYERRFSIYNTIYLFFALFIILNLFFLILFPGSSFHLFPAPRFQGFTENPNTIGIICFTAAPFFIFKFMTSNGLKKVFNFLLILLISFFVTLAFSRASILALVIIFATYFYYYNKIIFKIGILTGVLIIVLLIAFPILLDLIRLADNPFSYRDQLFEIGYKAWQENIFFGKGFGTTTLITGKQFAFVQQGFEEFNVGKHFGNIYFETLVENGIFGFIIFFFMLISLVKEIFPTIKSSTKEERIINIGLYSLLLAIFAQGFFESFILSAGNSAALTFWILTGIAVQSHIIKKNKID